MSEESEQLKKESELSQDPVHPWPLNVIEREWPKVKGAPWSFCLIGLVFIVIGGGAMFLLYSTFIIPGKDGTIELLRQELDAKPIPSTTPSAGIPVDQTPEYKNLQSEVEAQKAEFKTDLENLKAHSILSESYVDPDEWPALTDEQIKNWGSALAPYHIKALTVYWGQDVEAHNLFKSLQALGKSSHFDVIAGSGQNEGRDITIQAQPHDPAAPILQSLFGVFKCPVPLTYAQTADPNYVGEIDIFIGERPDPTQPSLSPTNSVSPPQQN